MAYGNASVQGGAVTPVSVDTPVSVYVETNDCSRNR